jgi:hypothetical protein
VFLVFVDGPSSLQRPSTTYVKAVAILTIIRIHFGDGVVEK